MANICGLKHGIASDFSRVDVEMFQYTRLCKHVHNVRVKILSKLNVLKPEVRLCDLFLQVRKARLRLISVGYTLFCIKSAKKVCVRPLLADAR
jgi:hypothetical protein